MKRTARDVARLVLRRVEQGEAYATLALSGALARETHLSGPDRGFATELVYGVLRHRARLDRALAAHAPRGIHKLPVPAIVALRVAAYQLLVLGTSPHAAVDDAVRAIKDLAPKLGGFANALLRKLATAGEPPPPADLLERLVAWHSTPRWIAVRLVAALGAEEAEAAAEAMNRPAPTTLRASLPRADRLALEARIRDERPEAELVPVASVPEALEARGLGAVETLAAYQEGLCTVQDAAAQRVGRMLGARPGERILDACAGVGGKSTHLQELALTAGGPARIDAADLSRRKLDLLEDAARRLHLPGIIPIVSDLSDKRAQLGESYDRILLDAPCSGLGVLRRHPEAKWRRGEDEVAGLADLQARLLDALAPRLKPGGTLVYSVCTFTEEEGPAQVRRLLAAHPELKEEEVLTTWPHRQGSDAFFAVRLARPTL